MMPISELYDSSNVKEVPVADVVRADIVTLMPTYDFFAPLRQVQAQGPDGKPMMGMTRDPLITARDFTSKPYKTHIKNGPGVLFDFFSQMDAEDRKIYRGFVAQAREHAKDKYDQMTKAQNGPRVELADASALSAIARAHGRRG